ncbi:uncharacterized protein PODANS_5_11883 [Podospora anserina S mat+]|uniref:Podospora anserina S mat+ genomic DNA chromosome 5, supercontig 7 n=1 Tax=Podospora anserina (strain S / ATCC MYA-4624 / DSM 980 / FGSC 10383) TaxID=515849 RepID=B2AFK8_PODAN|nr:uncharacterized protein PODANS_5_11883 [Podospora anserina S mat+]CAP62227.1 unnamed protein product [Podospora anserina S mat+]CDP29640.1 Putative protein of unknown function [Podospora anserina S mat+]
MANQKTEDIKDLKAFRYMQRQRQDYFDQFRRGLNYGQPGNEALMRMQVPKPGKWKGYQNKHARHFVYKIQEVWDEAGPGQTRQAALEANDRLAATMAVADFRLVKVLGWGGLGVASMYDAVGKDNKMLRVVCKIDIFPHYPCIPREVKAHLMTAGAKHVMQQVILQAEGGISDAAINRLGNIARQTAAGVDMTMPTSIDNRGRKRKRDPKHGDGNDDFEVIEAVPIGEFEELDLNEIKHDMKVDARKELDTNQRVLFIQFMNRGRLDDHICRAAMTRRPFPTLVLWQVFDLFRGVIGMAYPEAFMPWDVDPSKVPVPEVSETARGLRPLEPYDNRDTMVHYDIDPLNRKEQFSEEWDYINGNPRTIKSETAGNFNWWTNLYQIALVIWQMVSLCHAELPPSPEKMTIKMLDGTETTAYGFGGYILNDKKFKHIDRDLRELINQCMLHVPAMRPTMEQLENLLRSKTNIQGVDPQNQEQVEAQRYCEWLFRETPAPKPAQPVDHKLPAGLRGWTVKNVVEEQKIWLETPEEAARRKALNKAAQTRQMNPGRMLANRFGIVREVRNLWGDYFKRK